MTDTLMKAFVVDANKQRSVQQVPVPRASIGHELVKVAYTGLCGSDLFHLSGDNPRAGYPLIAGHEISGVVCSGTPGQTDGDPGSSPPRRFRDGDQVVVFPSLSCGVCPQCRNGHFQLHRPVTMIGVQRPGGFAQYVEVPQENLIPIPEGLDLKRAALVEPMAVAVHGFKLAAPFMSESVLVIGAGPIGIMLAMVADHAGCTPIFLTERSPNRILKAREYGFNCIDVQNEDYETIINECTKGKGVDMIFECVGHPSTLVQIPTVGAMRSRAVIVGAFHEPQVGMDLFAMSKKEQTIHLSWQYDIDDFRTALDVLLHTRFPVDSLISHILPLQQIPEALDLMRSGAAVKVLIDPNDTTTSTPCESSPCGGVV